MGKRYSISEARKNLPTLINDVEQGRPVELTRHGKSVAVVLSVNDYERLAVGREDLWTAITTFRQTHDLSELNATDIYKDVRDRSAGRTVNP